MIESRTKKGKSLTDLVVEVMALYGALRIHGEQITAPAAQTPARWQLLGAAQGRPLTVSQISRRMGPTRQSVQRVANILVSEGLATFEPNRDHARSPLFVLTDEGQRIIRQINAVQRRWSNLVASKLKLKDLNDTVRSLQELRTLLEEIEFPEAFFTPDYEIPP